MNNSTPHNTHGRFVTKLARVTVSISLVLLCVLILAQVYVRWTINQSFTFLGGGELEALTVSVFALVIAIIFAYRKEGSE
jgi:uncharacterized membrane protein YidH (DUF202 family)